jgi:hypothetical protein
MLESGVETVNGAHAFVDESKRRGLTLAGAVVPSGDLGGLRVLMRSLRMPGQSHLHFTSESPRRRRLILAEICRTAVPIVVYDATSQSDSRRARAACLGQLVADLALAGAARLVLEQDDSLIRSDRAVLFEAVRKAEAQDTLRYEHLPKRTEPLLWIADAVAWSYTADREWRRRVEPVLEKVVVIH